MKKICFICTGNTCRSPMAEKLLEKHILDYNIQNVKVESMGLSIIKNDKINKNAVLALKELGIRVGAKKAKQLTNRQIKSDTIYITMTKDQKSALCFSNNVFTFDEIAQCGEIPDPYMSGLEKYKKTADILNQATKTIALRLKQSEDKK